MYKSKFSKHDSDFPTEQSISQQRGCFKHLPSSQKRNTYRKKLSSVGARGYVGVNPTIAQSQCEWETLLGPFHCVQLTLELRGWEYSTVLPFGLLSSHSLLSVSPAKLLLCSYQTIKCLFLCPVFSSSLASFLETVEEAKRRLSFIISLFILNPLISLL